MTKNVTFGTIDKILLNEALYSQSWWLEVSEQKTAKLSKLTLGIMATLLGMGEY